MGNLFNALNGLKTNIFGGGNTGTTTPILRKHAIGMNPQGPLSVLDNDPFVFSSISYPRKQVGDYTNGHYILFYINVQEKTKYLYKDSDGGSVGNQVEETVSYTDITPNESRPQFKKYAPVKGFVDGKGDKNFKYKADLAARQGKTVFSSDGVNLTKSARKAATGMASYHPTTKRITDSVALYLPPNVTDTTTATYNGAATGVMGFAAAGAAGVLQGMQNKDYEAAAAALVGAGKGFLSEAAKKAATELAEGLTGAEGGAGLINKAFGQADNPYMEVLFDKMELRTFTYNFTFAPKNREERDDVQRIIALFRFHMSPELKGENNRFLTLPSEFDIHYMYQSKDGQASENDFYNKIATCVLQSCDVNYTPDGVNSFDDGSPTKMTMALTFQETELLTKARVNEGF